MLSEIAVLFLNKTLSHNFSLVIPLPPYEPPTEVSDPGLEFPENITDFDSPIGVVTTNANPPFSILLLTIVLIK